MPIWASRSSCLVLTSLFALCLSASARGGEPEYLRIPAAIETVVKNLYGFAVSGQSISIYNARKEVCAKKRTFIQSLAGAENKSDLKRILDSCRFTRVLSHSYVKKKIGHVSLEFTGDPRVCENINMNIGTLRRGLQYKPDSADVIVHTSELDAINYIGGIKEEWLRTSFLGLTQIMDINKVVITCNGDDLVHTMIFEDRG